MIRHNIYYILSPEADKKKTKLGEMDSRCIS